MRWIFEETIKSVAVDVAKCIVNQKMSHYSVGDGDESVAWAGHGYLSSALTNGMLPISESLFYFKRYLH
jgi:hypothetical protein